MILRRLWLSENLMLCLILCGGCCDIGKTVVIGEGDVVKSKTSNGIVSLLILF